ncbi:MAG: hypothetical protein V2I97_12760, partial [Desulfococcaceae bacterium]|nr:hypothetical protein [Desulfococcaceae bacterium]
CPAEINDRVFALELCECSGISGDWLLFYEGTVTARENKRISVRLEKRFGYRHRPDMEGIDDSNWWCIPRKKHCWSQVKFSDWAGKYMPGQVIVFQESDILNTKIGQVNALSHWLRQKCRQNYPGESL